MKYIWIGVIPDIFGSGITAASLTEAGAKKTLHKAYLQWNTDRTPRQTSNKPLRIGVGTSHKSTSTKDTPTTSANRKENI